VKQAVGLAYCDARGRIFFDERVRARADGGAIRDAAREELIPAPTGTVTTMLPGRHPLLADGSVAKRRTALAALLPAGYTRLLVPAYVADAGAPMLPLFGYTFACVVDDTLHVAAMRTDASEDWTPRYFAPGELEAAIALRRREYPQSRLLAQLAICARDYGCFTAQNTLLVRAEAALPVSPKCNARCVGCISELDDDAGIPSPQLRIAYDTDADELARVAIYHLERVTDGIISFGQGCEGEPLLRATTIARAIEKIRIQVPTGTINLNTNGSLPQALTRLIDAGLDAVRISLNSFRPEVYAGYYRPIGYSLRDVFESIERASQGGLRVALNLLTHPGVTDERAELDAMEAFLGRVRVQMVQTRTLNIDPALYFERVGRPREPLGMRHAIERIGRSGVRVGNFTHVH
jgi:pyruvate-formate lyase-activating enzyme